MKGVVDWIDSRTGVRNIVRAALYEHIPGGSRWRYVWGSTLVFAFAVQMITGFFLWAAYSPSATSAWESVYYIQNEMTGGWLLRGIHHYMAQIMVLLLALHVMQVVIDGAYRAPREFNFWIGIVLLNIVLGLGLTGYLLPWDQKGYWATKVATNIAGITPVIGAELRDVVVGGSEYGHHTLTRFFALHAGLLPALMIAFVALHIYLFRKHGVHPKRPDRKPDASFWPDQVLKDTVACLAVLAVVLFLVVSGRLLGGPDVPLGASLMAPAEPSEPYAAARPDWYFLFLYEFLKYFEGENEVWGAIYIPGIVLFLALLMPFVGRWKLGHVFNVCFLFLVLGGAGALTAMALSADASDPDYQAAVAVAKRDAERVRVLAGMPSGIPATGAVTLLRDDPKTRGPRLFARYCASCHRYDGHDGLGNVPTEKQTASDLAGFASRAWIEGFLDPEKVDTPHYFGATAFSDGTMVDEVKDMAEYDDEEMAMKRRVILALSAEARLPGQRDIDERDAAEIERGRRHIVERGSDGLNCVRCHRFHGEGKARGPELSGYGSFAWQMAMVHDPEEERFYGDRNDRMPAFGRRGILDRESRALIIRWLRGEWYEPGRPWPPEDVELPEPAPDESRTSTAAGADTEKKAAPATDGEPDSGASQPPAERTVAADIDFVADIKPILEVHCFKCHGGKSRPKGDFRMNTRALVMTPGDFGEPTIVPGDRSKSAVFALISSDDEDERMPPEGEAPPLTSEQIELIGAWIDAGAPWPDGVELELPPGDE